MSIASASSPGTAAREQSPSVVELCSALISFDSSNYGSAGSAGEREIADYIVTVLRAAGYEPQLFESAPGRANVVLRVPGSDRSLPALLVHGHIDVVPAEAEQWSVDPFGGLVQDGYIWGRGATDMKDMVANTLSTLLRWKEKNVAPRRDMVFAFMADEEEDGEFGSEWLVANHPEFFEGVVVGISESGGIPVEATAVDGSLRRFYPIATAERGTLHMTLRASGTSGHGSRPTTDNAVVHLIDALSQIAHYTWPIVLSPSVEAFLRGTTTALGLPLDLSADAGVEDALERIGEDLRGYVRPASRPSSNPTVLRAGYKVNVVPGIAEAELDIRTVPGSEPFVLAEIDRMLGEHVTREFISNAPSVSAPIDTEWFEAIRAAIVREDPAAIVLPFCMGGGTDAKAFAKLGIIGYGFSPQGIDPEGRVGSGMHGVDERVPVAALEAGARMLEEFLTTV